MEILLHRAAQSVMLSLGLGLKTKFFGLGLEPCGLVNITGHST